MNTPETPFVSVLTPVYNGEAYLRECIESVLAQTYSHWEYIVVNNCSTDGTLRISEEYARQDKRIQVHNNDNLLEIIANHNRAFRLISSESKYCKVVSADDWLFPDCLTRMVSIAEANPTVGIVGSYQLSGGGDEWYVRTDGLPYYRTVVPGREICRAQLLGKLNVFGNPTSNLYRSDLVRSTDAFYPNATAEADMSACFRSLQVTDFGFVHQVLSYERLHQVRITTTSLSLNAYLSARIGDLLAYGESSMTKLEIETRLKELNDDYYECLAMGALTLRDRTWWAYHKRRLRELGCPLENVKLCKVIAAKLIDLLLNPKHSAEKVFRRVKSRRAEELPTLDWSKSHS